MLDEIDKHLADIESVSEEVRESAIVSLAQMNDVKAIFALKKAAREDVSLRLRHLAKKALMELKKEITSVAPDLYLRGDSEDRSDKLNKLRSYLESPDPQIRMNAVRSTVTHKEPRAAELLQVCYGAETDPVIKGAILIAIGIVGRSRMAEFLATILKHEKEPLIRKAAIEGLSYTQDLAVYPLIVRQFAFDREKMVEKACMKALRKLGRDNLIKLFDRMMASGRVWRRQAAARALGKFNSDKVVPILERGLADESKAVQHQARRSLALLAKSQNPAAQKLVDDHGIDLEITGVRKRPSGIIDGALLGPETNGLESPDPDVRISTLSRIAEARDVSMLETLKDRLKKEGDERVRAVLVTAISRVDGVEAAILLKDCLKDRVPRVRANAVEALARLGDESLYPVFIDMLKDEDARTRANAIVALKRCSYVDVDQHIERMIKSGDGRMIRSAIHAIEEVQSEKAITLLANLAKGESQALKEKAVESLEILKERGSLPARRQLQRLMSGESGTVKKSAFAATPGNPAPTPEPGPFAEVPPPPSPPAPPTPPTSLPPVLPVPTPLAAVQEERPAPLRSDAEEQSSPPANEEFSLPAPRFGPVVQVKPGGKDLVKAKDGRRNSLSLPDLSKGVTYEAFKKWFDGLPATWRVAFIALIMVWGMVLAMVVVESCGGGDDF